MTTQQPRAGALGVIAGTGFYALDALEGAQEVIVDTAFGAVRLTSGSMHGRPTYFPTFDELTAEAALADASA